MVAGQSDWHLSHSGFHDRGPTMPKGMPPAPSSCSVALFAPGRPFTSGVPGPFCGLCRWLESLSTPAHGQTTIQKEGKLHPNKTAEHYPVEGPMLPISQFINQKEERGAISSLIKRDTATCWTTKHTLIYCVSGIKTKIPLIWSFN